jgi:hypothetical protein
MKINDLLDKKCFQIISASNVSDNVRIFDSRFVDEMKNADTRKAFEKSRLIVQAFNDFEKKKMLTQAPIIQQMSQRLILALTAFINHDLYLRDIIQIYVQSFIDLNKDFVAYLSSELNLSTDCILKIVKPIYDVLEIEAH